MKIFSRTVDYREIAEVIELGNFSQLQDLRDQSSLQIQLPNMFNNNFASTTLRNSSKYPLFRTIQRHTCQQSKITKNKVGFQKDDLIARNAEEFRISYYSLIKLLFPETSIVNPLDILIMDTLFFNLDGSMTYVYTDSKRGLVKTKSKNYIQLFFKRKFEIDSNQDNSEEKNSQANQKQKTILSPSKKIEFLKNLDYVALLRYKDENFIRLKDHEFKSIFIRPVQANQQYKIFNNTLYIQMIPQEINYEQGTIFNIEFNYQKQKCTELFHRAVQEHNQETAYNKHSTSSAELKTGIKNISTQAYLLYLIFQIYSYIIFHHHKQLSYGIFQFVKVKDNYFLSNTRQVKIIESQKVKNEYQSHQLFDEFVDIDQGFDIRNETKKSETLRQLEGLFDTENKNICNKVRNFINGKFKDVRDQKDQIESNEIFRSINQKCGRSLHYLFQNEDKYEIFLKRKQKQLDGFSCLTSISNISRKRHLKQRSEANMVRQKKEVQCHALKKNERKEDSSKMKSSRWFKKEKNVFSKWWKKT